MKAILIEDVEKLGKKGEIVKVKSGFFRNFLCPRSLAISGTAGNLRSHKEWEKGQEVRLRKEKEAAQTLAKKIANTTLHLKAQSGEEDKLFGSITNQEIASALEEAGIKIDKRKVELEEPIRKLGNYMVKVKLHAEVEASVKLKVVKE